MDIKSPEIKNLNPERSVSAIITGKSSYFSHIREYEKDLQSTFDAYLDALDKAMNWIYEFKSELKDYIKVYTTEYQRPAKAKHIPLKAGINEFVFSQRIRVFVKEVTEIKECSQECYNDWKLKDKNSYLNSLKTIPAAHMRVPGTVYKIVMGEGTSLKTTFENFISQLNELKKTCTMYDPVLKRDISLMNSCDEIVLLKGNSNQIAAGVSMTLPYIFEFEKPHQVEVYEVADLNCY